MDNNARNNTISFNKIGVLKSTLFLEKSSFLLNLFIIPLGLLWKKYTNIQKANEYSKAINKYSLLGFIFAM